MKAKRGCVWAFVGLLVTCTVVIAGPQALRTWPKSRTPQIDMYDLMLDLSVLPDGWRICAGPEPVVRRERGERESVSVWFCPPGFDGVGGTHQEVYRYRNEFDAGILYNLDFLHREFPRGNMIAPWAVPDEWSYQVAVADRFTFACGEPDLGMVVHVCTAVAKYDEYISVLVAHPTPDNTTLEEVEGFLIAIDERMALYLGKDME